MPRIPLAWIVPILLLAGCQQQTDPALPSPSTTSDPLAQLPVEAIVDPHAGLLAAADLTIDRTAGTAILSDLRHGAAIGDAYSELGLGPAFREMFGRNFQVVGLRSTGPTTVEIDFQTTHPFAPANRPDLAIFNLKCWMVTNLATANVGGVDAAPGLVTNADGYGRMWTDTAVSQPAYPAATIQPYVVINEDPTSAPFDYQNPAGFNVFFPGTSSVDTVALDLGSATTLQVRVYITADYGQSAVRATRQTPAYELPKFAGNAPWKVEVTELTNGLEENDLGSTATYQVDIWDWKHGQSLGSDVASATLHIPGITATPLNLALTGTGSDPTPLTATTLVTNTLDAPAGDYWGVVTAIDQATSGVGLDETFAPISLTGFSTYQLFRATVAPVTSLPPTANSSYCNVMPVKPTLEVHFTAAGSTPGTNPITTYEWDFDYVSPTFDVMATGITADYAYPSTGSFSAAVRVSDGFGNSNIAQTPITVSGSPGWSTPTRMTVNTYQEQLSYLTESSDALAVGPDGTAHLVWSQVEFSGSFRTLYWYTSLNNNCSTTTGWAAPTNFFTTPPFQQLSYKHSLLVTNDNVLHAVLPVRNGSSVLTPTELTNTGGVWSAPQIVMTAPGAFNPLTGVTIAADAANNVACLAVNPTTQPNCPGTPAVPWNIQFAKKTSGTWGPMTDIGDADMVVNIPNCGNVGNIYGYGAALAATPAGEWIAVWDNLVTPFNGFVDQNTGPTKLVWTRTTGGVWGAQSNLYTSAGQYRHPILERSPDGTVWLIARTGNASQPIGMARYSTAGSWDADMTTVLPSLGSTTYFSLNFDNDGRGVFTVSYQNSNVPFSSKRFRQTDAMATIAAQPADLVEPTIATFRYPNLVAGLHDGRYVAVWSTLKYGSAFWNDFELDSAIWQ